MLENKLKGFNKYDMGVIFVSLVATKETSNSKSEVRVRMDEGWLIQNRTKNKSLYNKINRANWDVYT